MATQGALIRAIDYNNVQLVVAKLLGDRISEYLTETDRGTYGYGQAVTSSQVVREVNLVTALDIKKLRTDVLKIARHCGIENNLLITALPDPNSGDLIENEHLSAFEAALPFLRTNRFELAVGQYSDESFSPSISNTRTTAWGNASMYGAGGTTVRHSFTVDFGSSANARYFFNSGSSLRFTASRSGGTNTFQNTSWTNMLNQMGTIVFNYNSTQGASGTGSSVGFYQLTNTPQQVFTKGGSPVYVYTGQYSSNDYTIYVHSDVANNQYGEARYLYVNIYFNDDHTANTYLNDRVDGNLTSNVTIRRASGSNVNVLAPTAVNTRILSSSS